VAADGVGSHIRQQFLPHAQVLDTGMRWLGGKTLLSEEIIELLPASMHERFAMVSAPHPIMMLGCVWFRTPPQEAARQFWPGLSFQHTEDYLMWGLLGPREQFPIPDEDLQAMDSAALQRMAVELTQDWYPTLSPLMQQADPEESFFLTMRCAVPIEHWQSSTITLLGDAIHVMPANGSGANSALRDASQLSRSLIAVASQVMPLQQALHDYEIEMLRAGFGAVRPFLQRMQRRQPGIPFEQGGRYDDQ
jgi:2-polyprenyl-6-methoxyphenol hydroxylase-like FAD-dependent oxidoreductase